MYKLNKTDNPSIQEITDEYGVVGHAKKDGGRYKVLWQGISCPQEDRREIASLLSGVPGCEARIYVVMI